MRVKIGLLPRIVMAIAAGVGCSFFFPEWATRIALTFNGIFGNFLTFFIPLLIFGLVAPSIADLGRDAGRLLLITAAIAYGFTLFSGFGTLLTCREILPSLLHGERMVDVGQTINLLPYFTIEIPPLMGVMTALVMAFVIGLGMAYTQSKMLKSVLDEFKEIVVRVIWSVVIPLLPIYIFGIFLSMAQSGQVTTVLGVFIKLIVVIFVMTVILLLVQFSIAGVVARRNPLKMLRTMLTAYMTALGTQSSAATIPVTLKQVTKLGVRPDIAGFVVPLCATIHLSGSMMKIVACSLAVMMLTGLEVPTLTYVGFVMLLAVTMVAAPGVPGGAIMAAVGLLESMLGFDETLLGLMIATYIAMDSFGTATNVTGDGAVAVIVNQIEKANK